MKTHLIGFVFFLILLGGLLGYNYFLGSELGGPCTSNSGCKGAIWRQFGTQCLVDQKGGYCTVSCNADSDCQKNWTCAQVDRYGDSSDVVKMCARPR